MLQVLPTKPSKQWRIMKLNVNLALIQKISIVILQFIYNRREREMFFKFFPNIYNILMEDDALCNWIFDRVHDPWMHMHIASIPCLETRIKFSWNWNWSINKIKFVLPSQCSAHWSRPRMIVEIVKNRCNCNRGRPIIWMTVINITKLLKRIKNRWNNATTITTDINDGVTTTNHRKRRWNWENSRKEMKNDEHQSSKEL